MNILNNERNTQNNNGLEEKVYLIALIGLLIPLFLKSTLFVPQVLGYEILYRIIQLASLILLIKIFIIDRCDFRKKLCFAICIMGLFSLSIFAHDYDVFYYCLFALGISHVDFHKALLVFLNVNFWGIILTILAERLNFISNQIQFRTGEPGIIRYSLGFSSPTDFGARFFYLILGYLLLRKFSLKFYEYIIIVIATIGMYIITNARLDTALLFFLIIVTACYPFINKIMSNFKAYFWYSCSVLFILFNLVAAYCYSPKIFILNKIDQILSGRLRYGHIALTKYKIELLGQFINEHGNGGLHPNPQHYFFIDSSYIRIFVMLGLLMGMIILIWLFLVFWKFEMAQLTFMIVYALFIILSSAFDQFLLDASYNLLLFTLFADLSWFKISSSCSNQVEQV